MSNFKGRGLIQMTGKQRRNMSNIGNLLGGYNNNPWTAQSHISITGAQGAQFASGSIPTLTTIPVENYNILKKDYFKKYEVIESVEDLLVLSATWYRLRSLRNPKPLGISGISGIIGASCITKLLDVDLFENITTEDRELASNIKDYYSKKIMMLKLKDIKLTKYREDLNNFIHSDGTKFQENICGLVYRLPEFYHYDLKFDNLIKDCQKEITAIPLPLPVIHTLTHLGTMKVNRRTSKRVEYWFKNENDNLVNISIDPTNPLMQVWDCIVQDDIKIAGKYQKRYRDNIEYFSIQNYSLA